MMNGFHQKSVRFQIECNKFHLFYIFQFYFVWHSLTRFICLAPFCVWLEIEWNDDNAGRAEENISSETKVKRWNESNRNWFNLFRFIAGIFHLLLLFAPVSSIFCVSFIFMLWVSQRWTFSPMTNGKFNGANNKFSIIIFSRFYSRQKVEDKTWQIELRLVNLTLKMKWIFRQKPFFTDFNFFSLNYFQFSKWQNSTGLIFILIYYTEFCINWIFNFVKFSTDLFSTISLLNYSIISFSNIIFAYSEIPFANLVFNLQNGSMSHTINL